MQDKNISKISFYFYYVCSLIFDFHFDSIFKVTMVSLILKNKDLELNENISRINIFDIFFSSLRPVLLSCNNDFLDIFISIKILEKCGFVEIKNDKIHVVRELENIPKLLKGKMITKCLNQLSLISDKSFVGEILYYV